MINNNLEAWTVIRQAYTIEELKDSGEDGGIIFDDYMRIMNAGRSLVSDETYPYSLSEYLDAMMYYDNHPDEFEYLINW